MPGGLLNLVSYGSENIILNDNPSKTFFKCVYKKYTNFGMQTFRIDHQGTNHIQENTKSTFKFKIKRYGDLLHDTYLSITLPDIYGDGISPGADGGALGAGGGAPGADGLCGAGLGNLPNIEDKFHFKWIKHLGYNMIDEVSIVIGGQLINKYSGEYLLLLQQQFQSHDRASHLNEMTGNTSDLNDPSEYIKKYYNYDTTIITDFYPSSYKNTSNEPSIKGKKLYIPINAWFGNSMKQALPLVSLQYHEVDIVITLRPIKELYLIQKRNTITLDNDNEKMIQSFNGVDGDISSKETFDLGLGNIHKTYTQFPHEKNDENQTTIFNYLAPQAQDNVTFNAFLKGSIRDWNPDIHLTSTFIFLCEDERCIFAKENQTYLIKICYEQEFLGLTGNHAIQIQANGLVNDLFWRYRRSDASRRNEWTNYTNIKYDNNYNYFPIVKNKKIHTQNIGRYEETNDICILKKLNIMFDGKIREESFTEHIYKLLQKYRTGNTYTRDLRCLYYYSFACDAGLSDLQPSGAVNTNKFKDISFVFETIDTPRNKELNTDLLVKFVENTVPPRNNTGVPFNVVINNAETNADPNGTCIPVFDKSFRQEKLYTFDLKVCSRKYNLLIINSGMGGLKYAR